MAVPLVILLRADDWHSRWTAVALALSAAAHGDPVCLALFEGALRDLAAGRFDGVAPPEAARSRVGSLTAMLDEAVHSLGVRVVACDTAVRLAGLEPADVAGRVEITSLPALWREAREGTLLSL